MSAAASFLEIQFSFYFSKDVNDIHTDQVHTFDTPVCRR